MERKYFWTVLENDLMPIPNHIINALDLCGFGNPLSFKTINSDDIDCVEDRIRQKADGILRHGNSLEYNELIDIFGEAYASTPKHFAFLRGERKLIEEMVEYVGKVLSNGDIIHGIQHFKVPPKERDIQMECVSCSNEKSMKASMNGESKKSDTLTHYFLNKLLTAADRNSKRAKGGYRYDPEIKLFASLLRMIAGPLAYETLQKNLECAIPSLPSTNRYIQTSNCRIIEGIPRCEELKVYLEERNLPLFVSLSEDATRIIGRIQYDSSINQLVGFALPINKQNGMPIPMSFHARNASEIIKHFSNGNSSSTYVNVIMAQPIALHVPAFCLLIYGSDNTYTSTDVSNRWTFITSELAEVEIKVLSISSDSDPKFNAAMRKLSNIGIESIEFPQWFSCDTKYSGPFFMQDLIHITTKIRNFLLNSFWNKQLVPFGHCSVEMEHLFCLLDKFPKDHHELTASILNPTDRQNFKSVLRMCDLRVINLLRAHVKNSEATIIFLQIIRDIIDSHMDPQLNPLQRVRKIWYSLFLIRIWRSFIKTSKQYTLTNNSFSGNCYSCIEINAHNMVLIMLYLDKINKPELFHPQLFSSQPCESMFRQFRSFTTTYSTVANCTVKESLSRISKIHYQNEIMYATSPHFIYPRLKNHSAENSKIISPLPTDDEIIAEIELSSKAAIATATRIGLIKSKSQANVIYTCKMAPYTQKSKASKRKHKFKYRKHKSMPKTPKMRLKDFKNIQLKDWSGKVNANEIDDTGPYAVIECHNNKKVVVKKTSLCWLLNDDHKKISSDRLQRVRNPTSQNKHQRKKNNKVQIRSKPIYPKSLYKPFSKRRHIHK